MRRFILAVSVVVIGSLLFTGGAWSQEKFNGRQQPAFTFKKVEYFLRHSKDVLQEYTPAGQEDLGEWTDMVSIITYRGVTDAATLGRAAEELRSRYQSAGGMMIKSVMLNPKPNRPAEYLIVVAFGEQKFVEVTFARLWLYHGVGVCAVYSRRARGPHFVDEINAWLEQHGAEVVDALASWKTLPEPPTAKQATRGVKAKARLP